jgi:methionyl-tRNA formyltransferase
MGSPSVAVYVLEALLDMGLEVVGVVTTPDKPAGRGQQLQAPPAKRAAQNRGLVVLQPVSVKDASGLKALKNLSPDLIVVAAYGKILPVEILRLPTKGCLNIHPSLLPRYRGPSPVATAIQEGDDTTGVSIIEMDDGVDTGPLVAQRPEVVLPADNAGGLTERLFQQGAQLLKEVLPGYLSGETRAHPQPEAGVSYTRKLTKSDSLMDWDMDAVALERRVRAFNPWPGGHTRWNGKILKILEAGALSKAVDETHGRVVAMGAGEREVGVVTGHGVLALRKVQLEGKASMASHEFVRGHRGFVGAILPT